jgi:hypothetical protein
VKKWAKTLPNTFFAKIITYISPWKKVAHKFELLPKVNNCPIGKKSPNWRKIAQSGRPGGGSDSDYENG